MSAPRMTVVDFETFYDSKGKYSLRTKDMSYPEYIHDKRFSVHCLGVYPDGEEPYIAWGDEGVKAALERHKDDIFVVHNGFFDLGVMAWRYNFHPAYVIDTLLLANHVLGSARDNHGSKNDLASLAVKLGLSIQKGDLSFSDGAKVLDEMQRALMEVYLKKDLLVTRGVVDALLPQVSNPDFELWVADHTLRMYTDRPLPIDMGLVERTRKLVNERLKERRDAAAVEPIVLSSNKQFAEELTRRLEAGGLKLPMKVSPTTGERIPALAKGDPGFMALTTCPVQPVVDLVRGRLVERSATQALSRLDKLAFYNSIGGMRTHLVYYGAHTGRWAAGGGFNLQNLTSPDRATDPVDREIAASIRAAITAGIDPDTGEELVFVSADAAQIEARVLAWLANEPAILEAFAAGADIYSQFISGATGEDIRKPKAGDSPELSARLKLWRHVGKESVLGLGFGMGVDKFRVRLSDPKNPAVAKLVESGPLTQEFVAGLVKTYRETYRNIVDFWYDLNRAFMWAKDGRQVKVGKLTLGKAGRQAVYVKLPSGRKLYYRDIRRESYTGKATFTTTKGGERGTRKEFEWKHGGGQRIYGGLLAENVTQAVARDVLAYSIWEMEQAGFPVVVHIHDELVCRVPKSRADEALKSLLRSLSTGPEWTSGLPLAAEGGVKSNLGK